jgi:hypothetical protein
MGGEVSKISPLEQIYKIHCPKVGAGAGDLILNSFNKTHLAAKEKMVRAVARMYKQLGLGVDPNASIEKVVAQLIKNTPKESDINKAAVKKACKKLSESLNKFMGQKIIKSDNPEKMCRDTFDMVYSLALGMNDEFLTVKSEADKIIKNIDVVSKILERSFNNLSDAIAKANLSDANHAALSVHQMALDELNKQKAILNNMVGSTIKPGEKGIIEVLKKTKNLKSLMKKITEKGKLSRVLSLALSGFSEAAHMAKRSNKALKQIGMSMSEYQKAVRDTNSLDKLMDKLKEKVVGAKSLPQLKKYLSSVNLLRQVAYNPEVLKAMRKVGGDDLDQDSNAKSGGAIQVSKKVKERRKILKNLMDAFHSTMLLESKGALKCGQDFCGEIRAGKVKCSKQLRDFAEMLSLMPNLTSWNNYLALSGLFRGPRIKWFRELYQSRLRVVIGSVEELLKVCKSGALSGLRKHLVKVLDTVIVYQKHFQKGLGSFRPNHNDDDIVGAGIKDTIKKTGERVAANLKKVGKQIGERAKQVGEQIAEKTAEVVGEMVDNIGNAVTEKIEGRGEFDDVKYHFGAAEVDSMDHMGRNKMGAAEFCGGVQGGVESMASYRPTLKPSEVTSIGFNFKELITAINYFVKVAQYLENTKYVADDLGELTKGYDEVLGKSIAKKIDEVVKAENELSKYKLKYKVADFTNGAGGAFTQRNLVAYDARGGGNNMARVAAGDYASLHHPPADGIYANEHLYGIDLAVTKSETPVQFDHDPGAGVISEIIPLIRATSLTKFFNKSGVKQQVDTLRFTAAGADKNGKVENFIKLHEADLLKWTKSFEADRLKSVRKIYECVAAVDLFIKDYNHQLLNNVNKLKSISKQLETTEVIKRLFTPRAIKDLNNLFESKSVSYIKICEEFILANGRGAGAALNFPDGAAGEAPFASIAAAPPVVKDILDELVIGDEPLKDIDPTLYPIANKALISLTQPVIAIQPAEARNALGMTDTSYGDKFKGITIKERTKIMGKVNHICPASTQETKNMVNMVRSHFSNNVTLKNLCSLFHSIGKDLDVRGIKTIGQIYNCIIEFIAHNSFEQVKLVNGTYLLPEYKFTAAGAHSCPMAKEAARLMSCTIKAMCSKILTTIGLTRMINTPVNKHILGFFDPKRLTMGAYGETPKVIPGAMEMYCRLPLLVEAMKELLQMEAGDSKWITFIPDVEGVFGGLIAIIFDRLDDNTGLYTLSKKNAIIAEVNKIYSHYKGEKDPCIKSARDLISEINHRIGILSRLEWNRYEGDRKDTRSSALELDFRDEEENNLALFESEVDNVEIAGPHTKYLREGVPRRSSDDKFDPIIDMDNHQTIIKQLRFRMSKLLNSIWDGRAEENYLKHNKDALDALDSKTLVEYIESKKQEFKNASNDEERLNVAYSLVSDEDNLEYSNNVRALIAFNELVAGPVKNLNQLFNHLLKYGDRVRRAATADDFDPESEDAEFDSDDDDELAEELTFDTINVDAADDYKKTNAILSALIRIFRNFKLAVRNEINNIRTKNLNNNRTIYGPMVDIISRLPLGFTSGLNKSIFDLFAALEQDKGKITDAVTNRDKSARKISAEFVDKIVTLRSKFQQQLKSFNTSIKTLESLTKRINTVVTDLCVSKLGAVSAFRFTNRPKKLETIRSLNKFIEPISQKQLNPYLFKIADYTREHVKSRLNIEKLVENIKKQYESYKSVGEFYDTFYHHVQAIDAEVFNEVSSGGNNVANINNKIDLIRIITFKALNGMHKLENELKYGCTDILNKFSLGESIIDEMDARIIQIDEDLRVGTIKTQNVTYTGRMRQEPLSGALETQTISNLSVAAILGGIGGGFNDTEKRQIKHLLEHKFYDNIVHGILAAPYALAAGNYSSGDAITQFMTLWNRGGQAQICGNLKRIDISARGNPNFFVTAGTQNDLLRADGLIAAAGGGGDNRKIRDFIRYISKFYYMFKSFNDPSTANMQHMMDPAYHTDNMNNNFFNQLVESLILVAKTSPGAGLDRLIASVIANVLPINMPLRKKLLAHSDPGDVYFEDTSILSPPKHQAFVDEIHADNAQVNRYLQSKINPFIAPDSTVRETYPDQVTNVSTLVNASFNGGSMQKTSGGVVYAYAHPLPGNCGTTATDIQQSNGLLKLFDLCTFIFSGYSYIGEHNYRSGPFTMNNTLFFVQRGLAGDPALAPLHTPNNVYNPIGSETMMIHEGENLFVGKRLIKLLDIEKDEQKRATFAALLSYEPRIKKDTPNKEGEFKNLLNAHMCGGAGYAGTIDAFYAAIVDKIIVKMNTNFDELVYYCTQTPGNNPSSIKHGAQPNLNHFIYRNETEHPEYNRFYAYLSEPYRLEHITGLYDNTEFDALANVTDGFTVLTKNFIGAMEKLGGDVGAGNFHKFINLLATFMGDSEELFKIKNLSKKVTFDWSNLIELVKEQIARLKVTTEKFRGIVPKAVIERQEKYTDLDRRDAFSSTKMDRTIYQLEKYLLGYIQAHKEFRENGINTLVDVTDPIRTALTVDENKVNTFKTYINKEVGKTLRRYIKHAKIGGKHYEKSLSGLNAIQRDLKILTIDVVTSLAKSYTRSDKNPSKFDKLVTDYSDLLDSDRYHLNLVSTFYHNAFKQLARKIEICSLLKPDIKMMEINKLRTILNAAMDCCSKTISDLGIDIPYGEHKKDFVTLFRQREGKLPFSTLTYINDFEKIGKKFKPIMSVLSPILLDQKVNDKQFPGPFDIVKKFNEVVSKKHQFNSGEFNALFENMIKLYRFKSKYTMARRFKTANSLTTIPTKLESGKLTDQIRADIISEIRGETQTRDRRFLKAINVIDLNVSPVNPVALNREIPLINLYNAEYTFTACVAELLGIRFSKYKDVIGAGNNDREKNKEVLFKFLSDPYSSEYDEYDLAEVAQGGVAQHGLGRPKFIEDIFQSTLMCSYTPNASVSELSNVAEHDYVRHDRRFEMYRENIIKGSFAMMFGRTGGANNNFENEPTAVSAVAFMNLAAGNMEPPIDQIYNGMLRCGRTLEQDKTSARALAGNLGNYNATVGGLYYGDAANFAAITAITRRPPLNNNAGVGFIDRHIGNNVTNIARIPMFMPSKELLDHAVDWFAEKLEAKWRVGDHAQINVAYLAGILNEYPGVSLGQDFTVDPGRAAGGPVNLPAYVIPEINQLVGILLMMLTIIQKREGVTPLTNVDPRAVYTNNTRNLGNPTNTNFVNHRGTISQDANLYKYDITDAGEGGIKTLVKKDHKSVLVKIVTTNATDRFTAAGTPNFSAMVKKQRKERFDTNLIRDVLHIGFSFRMLRLALQREVERSTSKIGRSISVIDPYITENYGNQKTGHFGQYDEPN